VEPRIVAFRRWLARLRVSQRALDDCLGARAGAWLARAVGVGISIALVVGARPVPGALDALVRIGLVSLSWCAGLAALSAAGPLPARALEAGRGLLRCRGIPLTRMRSEEPLALALWTSRHVGAVGLFVMAVAVAVTPEWRQAVFLLRMALGVAMYFAALGLGLGVLARLSHVLAGSRGRSLLVGLIFIPELVSPAWPELHTIPSTYDRLLDAWTGVEAAP
jgi:hypothetical protein